MSRLLAALIGAAFLIAAPAGAQTLSEDVAPSRTVFVPKDKSAAFRLTSPASEIIVSNPEIAQIVANTDRSVYIRGLAMGATNVLVYDPAKRLVEVIDIKVGYDTAALQHDLESALVGEKIAVTNLGGGVLLSGEVATTLVANRAKAIAERYAPQQVSSALTVASAEQVMLEVRILEANRTALKDIGFSLDIRNSGNLGMVTGGQVLRTDPTLLPSALYGVSTPQGRIGVATMLGSTRIAMTLDALEDKGVIRTLARPNLSAVSGEEASFLAGGEFPFPVPNGQNEVTIEFKPFGVQLKFTPTIQDSGMIKLKVAPEVSQLDNTNTLRLNGYEVPSLSIRKASTTMELKDGETFAMAGLFQQEYANSARQTPGLGDVPVLGALFRSARWRRHETELVILVTPRLVTADQSRTLAPNPLLATREPSTIDLILSGDVRDRPFVEPVGRGPQP